MVDFEPNCGPPKLVADALAPPAPTFNPVQSKIVSLNIIKHSIDQYQDKCSWYCDLHNLTRWASPNAYKTQPWP